MSNHTDLPLWPLTFSPMSIGKGGASCCRLLSTPSSLQPLLETSFVLNTWKSSTCANNLLSQLALDGNDPQTSTSRHTNTVMNTESTCRDTHNNTSTFSLLTNTCTFKLTVHTPNTEMRHIALCLCTYATIQKHNFVLYFAPCYPDQNTLRVVFLPMALL